MNHDVDESSRQNEKIEFFCFLFLVLCYVFEVVLAPLSQIRLQLSRRQQDWRAMNVVFLEQKI